ncbi:MAG: pantetheine-phosphate adenylyltransferase [Elusimicrobiota bacterium]|jgi:pantetheine-phosphate adenylyltransferase|nr:pantetheine-phosphate adenylyltransferase [Elusimicrobiota bacterium]
MKKDIIAVYPGSFDPLTNAHLDIISRAAKLFSVLIVAVAENPNKKHLFSMSERVSMIESSANIANVKVTFFTGLLADFFVSVQADVLIRGLRAVSDFEYEFQMALMNRNLNAKIETIFLMPDQAYTFLSSSMLKEIAMLGADIKDFVPHCVEEKLKEISISKK